MRVLVLTWEYPPIIQGGLARHVSRLSEQLAADGHAVDVLTRGVVEAPAPEVRAGVTVHRVPEPDFPRADLDAFLAWVERLNDHLLAAGTALGAGFDLVHSHDWLVADAARALARRRAVPWLVTVHATEHGRHGGWVAQHPQSHIHAAERRMARDADAVIVCSRFMRAHVIEAFELLPARVHAIPNGVGPTAAPATDLAALRARFAAPEDRLVLLAGRLVHEKGFHVALDALARLTERLGRVRFVIAGAGPAEAELRAQARRLGLREHGTFAGWAGDDDLAALYRIADLCVVPSLYEPFGLVALEAMAAGCPTIAADTGGLREVVPAGARFAAGSADALERLAERVLTDAAQRGRLLTQATARVSRFDWAAIADKTVNVYRQLS